MSFLLFSFEDPPRPALSTVTPADAEVFFDTLCRLHGLDYKVVQGFACGRPGWLFLVESEDLPWAFEAVLARLLKSQGQMEYAFISESGKAMRMSLYGGEPEPESGRWVLAEPGSAHYIEMPDGKCYTIVDES